MAHLLPSQRHFTLRWNPNSETQDYALDLADVFFGILRWTGTSGANSRQDMIPNGLWVIGSSESDLIKQVKTAFKELGLAYHFVEKRVLEDPSMEVELRVGDLE
jgi:hypothetical protein